MNILQVVSSTVTSGAEKHVLLLSRTLAERGHSVVAICPPGEWLPREFESSGIQTIQMPMVGLQSFRAMRRIGRISRQRGIDVIHTHLTRATYVGYMAGLLARVPVISSLHVVNADFVLRRFSGRRGHKFIAVSDHVRNAMVAKGTAPERVVTVYNGTDLAREDFPAIQGTLSVRAELNLPADSELIGLFGRVRPEKGQAIVIDAAREIIRRRPRAYIVFVGHAEPEYQQQLWEQAVSSGVEDRLRFTGNRDDVPRLMQAMDVVTLPSLTEACPMVVIEAMAMGKAVVGTRVGGTAELIEDQTTGLLVSRTPQEVGEALCAMLENPARREAMGLAGRERARRYFSAQAMTENIERLYSQMLGS
jgi:glycosyltransferase involved in cell wall biosynthesis